MNEMGGEVGGEVQVQSQKFLYETFLPIQFT